MVALICSLPLRLGARSPQLPALARRQERARRRVLDAQGCCRASATTGKDVYVLTSNYTFSGAEEFTIQPQEPEARDHRRRDDRRRREPRRRQPTREALRRVHPDGPRGQPHHEDQLGGHGRRARREGPGRPRAHVGAAHRAQEGRREDDRRRVEGRAPAPHRRRSRSSSPACSRSRRKCERPPDFRVRHGDTEAQSSDQ